jgi:NTE family protein
MSGGPEAVTVPALPAATSFFDGVPPDELASLLAGLERRRFLAGSVVIAEGDRLNEIYITQSGRADVFLGDGHGGQRRVGRVRPGTTLGEMSLFTGEGASGTVRAADDLELLVMTEAEFERLAARLPQVYRNLGAILAERLARTSRLAAGDTSGRLCLLVDGGARPELGYALACSVAWHTRTSALLLVLADELPDLLKPFAAGAGDGATARGHVVAAPSTGRLDDLLGRHATVLLQTNGREPPPAATTRTLDLSGAAPALEPADVEALHEGLLPPSTPAGRALGLVARDLAGLTVGLALGAGSLRGYAHLGVLRALERNGLAPDYLAGTSIGSAVAALYALGYDMSAAADVIDRCTSALMRPGIPTKSLLSNRNLRRAFQQFAGDRRIEDVDVPLALVAADVLTRQEVVIRRGLIWLGVLASSAIPGVWPAVRVGPHALVDGGVINPVPVSVAAGMGAHVVLAVRLEGAHRPPETTVEALETSGPTPSAVTVMMRSLELMQSRIASETPGVTTIAINPEIADLPGAKLRNFSQGRGFIEGGEAAAEAAMPRIAAALPWLRA